MRLDPSYQAAKLRGVRHAGLQQRSQPGECSVECLSIAGRMNIHSTYLRELYMHLPLAYTFMRSRMAR
jgi:hypothetical protein